MRRIVIVGPGTAGKSTLAARLGEITGLPTHRRRSRPPLRQAIAADAGNADIHVLTTPRAVTRFIAETAAVSPTENGVG